MQGENRFYWFRILAAIVLYVIPLIIYGIFVSANEETALKGLGYQTPLFLLASDLLVFSLRE